MTADAYSNAGVDIAAGERAVELMKASVARASRPEVVGGLGGFAGLFGFDVSRFTAPLLASSTDGVGTKTELARALGRYDTIGIDLVAMVVDDLVVCGAEPLFLQDYIACGRLDPPTVAAIVAGIAEGCRQAGCALVGGETAEHPGLMDPGAFDLAATAVGVVERAALLGPELVRPGDAVIALASSGLHANGFSLVRQVLAETGADLSAPGPGGGGRTLGEDLLEPTKIYALDCLRLIATGGVHAFAHVTGGGLAGNLVRVLPAGLCASIDRSTWQLPAVFRWLAERGGLGRADMERTFNMGIGMVAVLEAARAAQAVRDLEAAGIGAWVAGVIEETVTGPAVTLSGEQGTRT